MAKSEKEKKVGKKPVAENASLKSEHPASKSKKDDEEDDFDEADDKPMKKAARSSDEDEDAEDVEDDWNQVEEDENWDPDFDEFDIPKSKTKKSGGKKSADDDDLGMDDEFKDLGFDDFSGGGGGFDEEDDF